VIVDSSAIAAILLAEPDAASFAAAMEQSESRKISAATFVEIAIVVDGRNDPTLSGIFDNFIEHLDLEIVPLTASQARLARAAHAVYGRGRGHPARLNYGDCFAYALAKETGEPLLFKGRDFALTDLKPAL